MKCIWFLKLLVILAQVEKRYAVLRQGVNKIEIKKRLIKLEVFWFVRVDLIIELRWEERKSISEKI